MTGLTHWFGRRPRQRGISAAWGARAIFNSSTIDLLPDRQSWSDSNPETRLRLRQWIDENGLPWVRAEAKRLAPDASTVLIHDDGDFRIEASPQRSGGYLYIGAWQRTKGPAVPKTLAAWKARLTEGTKLRCSHRWHTPEINEVVTIVRVQTNAVAYDYFDGGRPAHVKPGALRWIYFPTKDKIRFTDDGFELLLNEKRDPLSRYHWLQR